MHDNATKVHVYQKEFEMHQRAFVKAVTRLHELDLKLSDVRNRTDAGVGVGEDVDAKDHNHAVDNLRLYWHDPATFDSDSDVESVY